MNDRVFQILPVSGQMATVEITYFCSLPYETCLAALSISPGR